MHLNVCQYSVQRVRWRVKLELKLVYEFPNSPDFRLKSITEFYLNNQTCISPPHFFLSCNNWHLNPQSTFNVCLQSIMDVYFVYCWFAKSMFCVTDNVVYSSVRLCSLATRMLNKNICLCSNQCLFICQVLLCLLVSSVSFSFFLCAKLVLDELAYDGLSFKICAIKVFWVLYFAQGKLYGCHRCCILKQIFILLMLRNTENKMEL